MVIECPLIVKILKIPTDAKGIFCTLSFANLQNGAFVDRSYLARGRIMRINKATFLKPIYILGGGIDVKTD